MSSGCCTEMDCGVGGSGPAGIACTKDHARANKDEAESEAILNCLLHCGLKASCIGAQGLPEQLLPYMRLAHATDSEVLRRATLETCCAAPISPDNERTVLHQLASHLQACLAKCAHPWNPNPKLTSPTTSSPSCTSLPHTCRPASQMGKILILDPQPRICLR